jgi:hypothetical protein
MMTTPFESNHANPWTTELVDLEELNANASEAIALAIKRVRESTKGERTDVASASILVLGPAGAGKTHLFARLRRKLGPRAVLVHLRPLIGTEMTPRYVLGEIVRQLDYEIADGSFRQLDALVGATLAYLKLQPVHMPRPQLDDARSLDDQARRMLLAWAVEQLVQRHPEIDEAYAQRLFEVPFASTLAQRRAALAWLAGRDLEQAQMSRLGVSSSLSEERIVPALQTLGLLATPGAPIVLVFDQLENLMDAETTGGRVRAYANLVAELFDTMRGIVIVQMALDTEWDRAIAPHLGQTQKTRLADRIEVLRLPTAKQKRELVRRWVEQLPERHSFPEPFGERRLDRWCGADGMTPRMLMIECRKALAEGLATNDAEADAAPDTVRIPEEEANAALSDAIRAAWEEHLAAARTSLDECAKEKRAADPARLIGGIASVLRFVPNAQAMAVDARKKVALRAALAGRKFAFCLVHERHPKAVAGTLDRAKAESDGSTLVVLRERALDFPPTWKQIKQRLQDLASAGARVELLERDDAASLLALESFVSAARSGDVDDDQGRVLDEGEVSEWIRRSLDVPSWPLVRLLDADAPRPAPAQEKQEKKTTAASDAAPCVETCLAQLHIASVDRLVREVVRVRADATRTEVLAALEEMKTKVRWFGRSIVAQRREGT